MEEEIQRRLDAGEFDSDQDDDMNFDEQAALAEEHNLLQIFMSDDDAAGKQRKRAEYQGLRNFEDSRCRAFFLELAKYGNKSEACTKAGISPITVRHLTKHSQVWAELVTDCQNIGHDALLDEAKRRAYQGTLRPVFYQGEHVGDVREYSDTLMQFLLRGLKPELFDKDYHKNNSSDEIVTFADVVRAASKMIKTHETRVEAETLDVTAEPK